MDEVNKIRKSFFTNCENRCQIAKKMNRSWDTVNRVVKMKRDDLEHRGKHPDRLRKIMTPTVIAEIEKYFQEEDEKGVKKKQKHTARQIYEELKDQQIYKGSIRRMQEMVRFLRGKYGQTKSASFLPLYFPLGSSVQIDHGEFEAEIEDVRVKGYLFVAGVPGQVLRYCQIYPTKSKEAWGEFHEKTFLFFGGIFQRLVYDNDTVLVKKVIGNERKQTNFSLNLEEHYGFESHFCNIGAGNEKGAVENAVGYCRRRFLSGLPSFTSWESGNEFLSSCCLKDIENGLHYKSKEKLSDLYKKVKEKLNPLMPKKKWYRWVDCRVDKCQLITIDSHQYSVQEKFVGAYVRVGLSISTIEVFKDEQLIAVHQRQYGKKDVLDLDHYLDQLLKKPFSFSYAKAVTQHTFHPKLVEMRDRLLEKYGNKEAIRQFVLILLLRRHWSQKELLQSVEKALDCGAIDYSAVEIICRQRQLSETQISKEDLHSLIPVSSMQWEFDLSLYTELCDKVQL